ncbi:MAG: tetratricopeptide repeat protein [Gallionellaceae bacterium]|jgi:tetratricopeptide (TPR) repeat protein|nr:tetratricopeptide repeat protein [Gallionellaceae bacterium]
MSLLLDARKKSQQAQAVRENTHTFRITESSLEKHQDSTSAAPDTPTIENARNAGRNLFNAKPYAAAPFNRNLLLALGGVVLLSGASAAYWWHIGSTNNTTPPRPDISLPIAQQPAPAATGTQQPITATQKIAATEPPAPTTSPVSAAVGNHAALHDSSIHIKQHQAELIEPLLKDAYLAYRSGKLDEAQQLYLNMLRKDAQNPDALLGLASIAQQRDENQMAAQYYTRVLALDPRNAPANAGMSALSANDENNESSLKILLREQGNSAALHFALGNLYAGQSRWGEAQQAYFNAYTLESDNAEFAFNLAVSLDHLGQKQLAAQYYQRALELDQPHAAGFDHIQTSHHVQELTR